MIFEQQELQAANDAVETARQRKTNFEEGEPFNFHHLESAEEAEMCLVLELCGRIICFGIPPNGCSAFGPGTYMPSLQSLDQCVRCPDNLGVTIALPPPQAEKTKRVIAGKEVSDVC